MALTIGQKAPDFTGNDQDGNPVTLADFKGKKVVLYFYPKDNTPGCTAQACNLRDNYQELQNKGYVILGVSIDNEKSHQKFIQKQNLPFILIADTDKRINELYGVWKEKSMYGRTYMGIMPGMMVCSGRLPGATQLGWPGSTRKPEPRFWKLTPLLGLTSPEPKPWKVELMKEMALRSADQECDPSTHAARRSRVRSLLQRRCVQGRACAARRGQQP